MSTGWSAQDDSILRHEVTDRHLRQLQERRDQRQSNVENKTDLFIRQHHLEEADGESIIVPEEAEDLAFWARL